jgi:hypothetical protein
VSRPPKENILNAQLGRLNAGDSDDTIRCEIVRKIDAVMGKPKKFDDRQRRILDRRRATLRVLVPLLISFIFLIGIMVAEVGKRNEVFSYIDGEISALGRQGADAIANSSGDPAKSISQLETLRLQEYRRLREGVRLISVQGDQSSSPSLSKHLEKAICLINVSKVSAIEDCNSRFTTTDQSPSGFRGSTLCEPGGDITAAMVSACFAQVFIFPLNVLAHTLHPLLQLRSEALVAMSVVLAGAVGAIGQSLVKARLLSALSVVVGLFAGFFAYLLLRGGRSFLLADLSIPGEVMVNPYSMVLLGLIVGYVAPIVFDELERRLERLLSGREDDDDDQPPSDPPGASGAQTGSEVGPAVEAK